MSGGNVLWRSYFTAIHIPGDKGFVKAATITIALIMTTMWINNGRDESNVEPVNRLSFLVTFTNTQFIIYSQMHCFITEVKFCILICRGTLSWHRF